VYFEKISTDPNKISKEIFQNLIKQAVAWKVFFEFCLLAFKQPAPELKLLLLFVGYLSA
jgi:hypothetical protein